VGVLPIDSLAKLLADRIVEFRCKGCPHTYAAWKTRANGGTSTSARKAISAFIKPVFGLPECPDFVPIDHREGYVGEMLWYFLHQEVTTEGIIHIEPPSFKATDPGADALVVHRMAEGYLMFRLWEMKKCTGTSHVSSTVSEAYSQLDTNALEYLARYTAIGQTTGDPDVEQLCAQLVDLWLDSSQEAAAGVSVATSSEKVPTTCFSTFGDRFPGFVQPVRLRGILTAIEDFPLFTGKVREFVWTGL